MKTSKNIKISLSIILLFSTAIASTFISEYFSEFLVDWKCKGYVKGDVIIDSIIESNRVYRNVGCNYSGVNHNPEIHWGYRHHLYMIMCSCLFLVQAISILNFIFEDE